MQGREPDYGAVHASPANPAIGPGPSRHETIVGLSRWPAPAGRMAP